MTSQRLLAEADLFLLWAKLLRSPQRVKLPSLDDAAALARAADAEHHDSSLVELVSMFANAPEHVWSDEYHRLFEGPLQCPINETAYIRRDKGAILADLCGFYGAFGFATSLRSAEKPDHLRCELEFLSVLLVMLAQATQRGDDDRRDIVIDAVCAFTGDHVNEWSPLFCARLTQTTRLDAYRLFADHLRDRWRTFARFCNLQEDAAHHHITDELHTSEVGTDHPDEWPMECGGAASDGAAPCHLTIDGLAPPAERASE